MSKGRKLKVSFGKPGTKNLGTIENVSLSWDDLVSRFKEPVRDDITMAEYLALSVKAQGVAKNKGYFVGGQFESEKRRKHDLTVRSVATLDIDECADDLWANLQDDIIGGSINGLAGMKYHVHTTRKHTAAKPRFRVLIPLAREVTPHEYVLVVRYLAELVDEEMRAVAHESFNATQIMYLPSIGSDGEFYQESFSGEFFDPDTVFEKYSLTDTSDWPRRPEEIKVSGHDDKRREHPEDKRLSAPIVTAVFRAFPPEEFIERFLSDVYQEAGEGRYMPFGASGAPSVRIYDEAFIQSDHSHSDVAHGQHTCFDSGRLHLFGHLDKDQDEEILKSNPSKSPSFQAMEKFMKEQPEVREALEEIAAEIEEDMTAEAMSFLPDLDDEEDDEDTTLDDLIGDHAPKPKKKKPKTLEEFCAEVSARIRNAVTPDDLDSLCQAVANVPSTFLNAWRREAFINEVLQRAKALGTPMTKAFVAKQIREKKENLLINSDSEELPDWLDPIVFVEDEAKFLDQSKPDVTYSKDGFNIRYLKEAVKSYGALENGTPRYQPVTAAMGGTPSIPIVRSQIYDPLQEKLAVIDDQLYVNVYRPAVIQRSSYTGTEGVKFYKRMMADFFPDRRDMCLAMDFFAHCIKFPGVKLPYALLLKGVRGEGKSTMSELVVKMLGQANCTELRNSNLSEKHNGWIINKCFVAVEEIKIDGKDAYATLDLLKPLITNRTASVRAMQKDAVSKPNLVNMYLMTNHENAVPIDANDSRYLVLFTRFFNDEEAKQWHTDNIEREGFHYVSKLKEHIQQNPWQFKAYFDKYQFSEFYRPNQRAPTTRYRELMADNTFSDEADCLEHLISLQTSPLISDEFIVPKVMRTALEARNLGAWVKTRAIEGLLSPLGFIKADTSSKSLRVPGSKNPMKICVYTRDRTVLTKERKLTDDAWGKLKLLLIAHEDETTIDDV